MRTTLLLILIFISFNFSKAQFGLIAHYPLNGNANDISGNGHNATIIGGPAVAADQFGNLTGALSFDGINDYLSLPVTPFLLNNYSYSVCVRPTSLPANNQIFTMISVGDNTADQYLVLSNLSSQNLYGFHGGSYFSPGITPDRLTVGVLPSTSLTYHVVVTRSNDSLSLFVDGMLINSISTSIATPSYGSAPFEAFIGRRVGTVSQHFNGIIEDVKIYNRALSQAEINGLCSATAGIQDLTHSSGLNFYLNSAHTSLHLSVNNSFISELGLFDVSGKEILRQNFSGGINEADVYVGYISTGLYIIEAKLENNSVLYAKFLKAR